MAHGTLKQRTWLRPQTGGTAEEHAVDKDLFDNVDALGAERIWAGDIPPGLHGSLAGAERQDEGQRGGSAFKHHRARGTERIEGSLKKTGVRV